jgi:hypothetical protein
MKKILLSVLLSAAAVCSQAAVISADFKSAADLPYCCFRSGPVTVTALNQTVGAGFELDGSSTFSNPSGWSGGRVYADLDPVTGLLTLDSQDTLDFQSFVFTLTNMQFSGGQSLLGLSTLTNSLTDNGIVPTLAFTGNSLSITYDIGNTFNFTGNNATFQLDLGTSGNVPEPGSLALFGLALAAMAAGVRRRKA